MFLLCFGIESVTMLEGVLSSIASRPSGQVTRITDSQQSATKYEEMRHEEVPRTPTQLDKPPNKRRNSEVGAAKEGGGREEEEVESNRLPAGVLSSIANEPSGHAASITHSHQSGTKYEEMRHEEVPRTSTQLDELPNKRRNSEVGAAKEGSGREEKEVESNRLPARVLSSIASEPSGHVASDNSKLDAAATKQAVTVSVKPPVTRTKKRRRNSRKRSSAPQLPARSQSKDVPLPLSAAMSAVSSPEITSPSLPGLSGGVSATTRFDQESVVGSPHQDSTEIRAPNNDSGVDQLEEMPLLQGSGSTCDIPAGVGSSDYSSDPSVPTPASHPLQVSTQADANNTPPVAVPGGECKWFELKSKLAALINISILVFNRY